uniref:hypothetical protein n=1 Tax=Acetatifactor sp. TaxID=1872090 RepID=UPI004057AFFC
MYLNEIAWNVKQDNPYVTQQALREFLKIYMRLSNEYHLEGVYVSSGQELQLKSTIYPLAKWMSDVDRDERMRMLSFWNKRIVYTPEDECEVLYKGKAMRGGTEAVVMDSFLISPCLAEEWKKENIEGILYTVSVDAEEAVSIINVYEESQLKDERIQEILSRYRSTPIYSYEEIWRKRDKLFPMLSFCPSVEEDLKHLEVSYIHQVLRKLLELEMYCEKYLDKPFQKDLLTKTTPESDETLKKYPKEHTFIDADGQKYLASWHMRFTGIPGRIFFIPDYSSECMLVCYIGKKLKTVQNP